jgi:hypothetical protein
MQNVMEIALPVKKLSSKFLGALADWDPANFHP